MFDFFLNWIDSYITGLVAFSEEGNRFNYYEINNYVIDFLSFKLHPFKAPKSTDEHKLRKWERKFIPTGSLLYWNLIKIVR